MFVRLSSATVAVVLLASAIATPLPSREHVAARDNTDKASAGIVPIWGENGPQPQDVKQTTIGDCWIDATMVAIAGVSSDWMKSIFLDLENRYASQCVVHLTGPQGHRWYTTVNYEDVNQTSLNGGDASLAGEYWWPGAIEVAMVRAPNLDRSIEGGWPNVALQMLTGVEAVQETDPERWWSIMAMCDKSPVVVSTGENVNTLVGAHAYAVTAWGKSSDGVLYVELHNPWGITRRYVLDDIIDDLDAAYHLANFDYWAGDKTARR